jgi:hypothetical protein
MTPPRERAGEHFELGGREDRDTSEVEAEAQIGTSEPKRSNRLVPRTSCAGAVRRSTSASFMTAA